MVIYRQVFLLGLKKAYHYKINFYLGLINFLFPLTIQFFLWTGLFQSSNQQEIFGYTLHQMILYSICACLVTKVANPNFVFQVNDDIKNGGLAKYLIRPVNYFFYTYFSYIGEKLGGIFCSSVILLVLCAVWNISRLGEITIVRILLFFITLFFAVILNFMIYYCVSGLGFWMRDASGVIFITTLCGTIISGGIFPLDIFSETIQRLLHMLPFPYTSYFPVTILCSEINSAAIINGIFLQFFWIVFIGIFIKIIWYRGLKKYISVGG